ncbi:MAG: hypothetical protein EAZ27_06830 [Cytophagales bacterium]|nr:MAG: hypothetical protein EAZ27_06830 [Cytophagales bacterium]
MYIILCKVAICILFSIILLFFTYDKKWSEKFSKFKNLGYYTFLFSRLILFYTIYIYLGYEVQSDVKGFFLLQANDAIKLKIVYRDYDSFYNPLFSYLLGIVIFCFKNPISIVFFMILVEFIGLIFTEKLFKDNDCNINNKILIYSLLPAPLIFVVIGGQEDCWMWSFLCVFIIFFKMENKFLLGISLGVAFLFTKLLLILFVIILFIKEKKRFELALGFAIITIPIYGFLLLNGADILVPLKESNSIYAPNLWTVFYPVFNGNLPIYSSYISYFAILVAVFGALFLYSYSESKRKPILDYVFYWTICYILLVLFSKKSLGNYILIYLLPFIFYIDLEKKSNIIFLLALNFVAVIQPSLWFRLEMPLYSNISSVNSLLKMVEYFMEWIFVILLIWNVFIVLRTQKSHNF